MLGVKNLIDQRIFSRTFCQLSCFSSHHRPKLKEKIMHKRIRFVGPISKAPSAMATTSTMVTTSAMATTSATVRPISKQSIPTIPAHYRFAVSNALRNSISEFQPLKRGHNGLQTLQYRLHQGMNQIELQSTPAALCPDFPEHALQ